MFYIADSVLSGLIMYFILTGFARLYFYNSIVHVVTLFSLFTIWIIIKEHHRYLEQKHRVTYLTPDLWITRESSDLSLFQEGFDHIAKVGANSFVCAYGDIYPIYYYNQPAGIVWEYYGGKGIPMWPKGKKALHFGIFTFENIRGKNLGVVKRYLDSNHGRTLYLHTMEQCNVVSFYQKYGFQVIEKEGSHILMKRDAKKKGGN